MRVLLIDGDTVVYQAGQAAQKAVDWGDGFWSLYGHELDGAQALDDLIARIKDGTNADRVIVALSDYDNPGWRLDVMPTYKAARATKSPGSGRPMLWTYLRRYFIENYETFIRPTLEGDDVLGILATSKKLLPQDSERIICSIDKDMNTLPAFHLNFTKNATAFGWDVREVKLPQADYYHLLQTLMGDSTDGYPGCKKVGPVTAAKILAPFATVGLGIEKENLASAWQAIVKAYEKAGLTETEALQNARVARICRATDYDFNTKQVKLWNPPK